MYPYFNVFLLLDILVPFSFIIFFTILALSLIFKEKHDHISWRFFYILSLILLIIYFIISSIVLYNNWSYVTTIPNLLKDGNDVHNFYTWKLYFIPYLTSFHQFELTSSVYELGWNLGLLSSGFVFLTCLIGFWCLFYYKESCTVITQNYSKSWIQINKLDEWSKKSSKNHITYYIIILFLLINLFYVNNILWFFIFYEALIIPMFLLILDFSDNYNRRAWISALLFFFFTLIGSVLLFLVIVTLSDIVGSYEFTSIHNFIINSNDNIYDYDFFLKNKLSFITFFIDPNFEIQKQFFFNLLGLLTAFAFFVKLPLYMLHIWLTEAHVEANTPGSMILASILLKLGVWGILNISCVIGVTMFDDFGYLISIFIGLCSIVYFFLCLSWNNLKTWIAYSSVIHMNFLTIGLLMNLSLSMKGVLMICASHAFISAGLFYIAGIIYEVFGTKNIGEIKGLIWKMPYVAWALFFLSIANASLPFFVGFIGEIVIFVELIKYSWWLTVLILISFFGVTITFFLISCSIIFGDYRTFIGKLSSMKTSLATTYEVQSSIAFFGVIAISALQPWLLFDVYTFDFFIEFSDYAYFNKKDI